MVLGDKNVENIWPSACQLIKDAMKRRLIHCVCMDQAKHLTIYIC